MRKRTELKSEVGECDWMGVGAWILVNEVLELSLHDWVTGNPGRRALLIQATARAKTRDNVRMVECVGEIAGNLQ